jgi:hypothetical protein
MEMAVTYCKYAQVAVRVQLNEGELPENIDCLFEQCLKDVSDALLCRFVGALVLSGKKVMDRTAVSVDIVGEVPTDG